MPTAECIVSLSAVIGASGDEPSIAIAAQPNVPVGFVSTPAFISRNTGMAEGYTTDGTYHYVISTTSLIKCLDNAGWTVIATNSTPFAGLTGYSHLGDGCYYNGKLYVAGEYYNSCADFSSQSIFVFNASDLSRDSVHNISAQGHEVSGIAVANGVLYVTDFCRGAAIHKYDLTTFAYLGDIALSVVIPQIQGITYKNGVLYLAQDTAGSTGALWGVVIQSGVAAIVMATPKEYTGEWEGVDFSQDTMRWLCNDIGGGNRVYYFTQSLINRISVVAIGG